MQGGGEGRGQPSFSPIPKQMHRSISSRDFSHNNLLGFKRELGITNWDHVYVKNNVDKGTAILSKIHREPHEICIDTQRIFLLILQGL
jgi:hypothetical protein